MNELWYDDLSLKSEDIKILPIKFEYLIGRHFKKWGVYFFDLILKGVYVTKTYKVVCQFEEHQGNYIHQRLPMEVRMADKIRIYKIDVGNFFT